MPSSTRRVTSFSPRRPIGPVCGVLLLILCASVRANDAPAVGLRLPAGGILEKQDPRLAVPGAAPAKPAGADKAPLSDEAQGPVAATRPASSAGTVSPANSPESKQFLNRRGAPESTAGRLGEKQGGKKQDASSWPMWDALPLAVVLALIAGAALVIKKYMPAKRMLTGAGALDIVARLPLSGKQSLLLVRMGRRLVLVGVSPEQMASLTVVDDPEQVAAIVGRVASRQPDSISHSFANALGDETQAYAEEPEARDPSSAAGGCVRSLLEKVRQFTRKQEVA